MSDLLAVARSSGTPVVAGRAVTFLWEGPAPPRLMGDFTDWEADPIDLEPVAPGFSALTREFPADAYLEYSFLDPESGGRVADPLNDRTTPDGMGNVNHFFFMPEAAPSHWAEPGSTDLGSAVTEHHVAVEGILPGPPRSVHLYRPPRPEPAPLLVVFDGKDYLERGALATIVDNLITAERIQPIALAMVDNGGESRIVEYGCSEATLMFLMDRVLPLAESNLRLQPRGGHGVLGASFGGVAALHAGLRLPAVFGRVLSQSGAFVVEGRELVPFDLVRLGRATGLDIWLDVGRYEWLLDANRRMRDALVEAGVAHGYHEFNAGHNYPAWRDDLWRGLEILFPPE